MPVMMTSSDAVVLATTGLPEERFVAFFLRGRSGMLRHRTAGTLNGARGIGSTLAESHVVTAKDVGRADHHVTSTLLPCIKRGIRSAQQRFGGLVGSGDRDSEGGCHFELV